MNLTGSRTINADVKTVWAALLDPDVLKDCVPGCTEMAGSAEEGFEAKVVQKVGPIKATFKGIVEISDRIEYQSLKISGEGKGGPAGFAKGGADVRLEGQGDSTVLNYDVEAKVGGKLAQLGSRVIDGFASKMADQFFENFQNAVEKGPTGDTTDESAASSDDAPAAETDEPKKGWLGRIRGR
ncbi:CoxG family protein [Pontivivens nitratireducens]|uniref:Carbon monoxide dehydrogenase subunit G n=1 Tax=Pontivivens nitratireducens TaxID=2758038 RepID=A0A6G7VII5_9RHOB|nr:carbon monoxide dehydrogenase subunit G [Pontibrevibacter nitratireducens]QIK39675.1 carbon monoxide dehydrogenase subunit G [Pontibrevibacter nitratireducens]